MAVAYDEISLVKVMNGKDGAGLTSTSIDYQGSTNGREPPTGEWTKEIPEVKNGNYLWTRTTFRYNDGQENISYSVSRMGDDAVNDEIKDKIEDLEQISKDTIAKSDKALEEAEKARDEAFNSSAIANDAKEKAEKGLEQSNQALIDAEKDREDAKVLREQVFNNELILKQAELDALTALALGDGNRTQISNLEGQQKITNSKVEGNTVKINSLQSDADGMKVSLGKVQADVENINVGLINLASSKHNKTQSKPDDYWFVTISEAKTNIGFTWKPNTEYTIVMCGRVLSEGATLRWFVQHSPSYDLNVYDEIKTKENSISTKTFKTPKWDGEKKASLALYNYTKTGGVFLEWIMVFEGNKAPKEYVQSQYELTTKSEFATFEANYKGFQTTVTSDITGLQSQQTQTASQLSSTIKDVDGLETEVTQLSNQWAVTAQEVKTLDTTVTKQQGQIVVLTDQISQTVTDLQNVNGVVTEQQGQLNILSNEINATVKKVDENTVQMSEMKQTQNTMTFWITELDKKNDDNQTRITSLEFNLDGFQATVKNDLTGMQGQLTLMDSQMDSTIKKVETVEGKQQTQQSQITQLYNQLDFKVSHNEVISRINMSPEQILIKSKLIHLSGQSLIDDAVIKGAMIQDATISGAKIQNATIANANIISINANKVVANTLSAITTNTGTLNISGWMNILTENMGIRGTYDFKDDVEVLYPRRYEGEFRLSHRHLFFNARADKLNTNGSIGSYHGYGESFYGANYFKSRWYDNTAARTLKGRIDIRDDFVQVSNSWSESEYAGTTIKPSVIYTEEVNVLDLTARTTGSNIYFNRNRSNLADLRIGVDGTGKLVQSQAVYSRTYNAQAPVCVTPEGNLGRIVSAKKYKTSIEVADDLINKSKTVLSILPKSWNAKNGDSTRYYGFIADDFDDLGLKEVVLYNEFKEVEGLLYDRITTYHNVILSEHEKEIQELKIKIKNLEERLEYANVA